MLAVVMEPACKDTKTWQGVVGGKLGSRLYCDASEDGDRLDASVEQIIEQLGQLGVFPSALV